MAEVKMVVLGAAGRMGRTIVSVIAQSEGAVLHAALEPHGSPYLRQDAGELAGVGKLGLAIGDNAPSAVRDADVVIDFTRPEASVATARLCADAGIAHVIGTTGFSPADEDVIEKAAATATIVKSGNMSLGVNLLAGLVEQAARALGPEAFDIEILEMHHRHKVDAPSGTALLLGEAAAEGRGVDLGEASVRVRDGHTGPREVGAIGFATLRGGSVVGEHTVILAGEGELIELTHRATDRAIFARGAVRAALWAAGRPSGLYSMRDVLGLSG